MDWQEQANRRKEQTTELKSQAKELSDALENIKKDLENLLIRVPNLPHHSVPAGKSVEDNEIVQREGEIPELPERELHLA